MDNITDKELKKLAELGLSATLIGKQFGISKQAAHQRLKKLGYHYFTKWVKLENTATVSK